MKKLLVSIAAAIIGAAPAAYAGPVTSGSGSVVMTFDTPSDFGQQTRRTFDVTFPETRVVEFNGQGDDDIGSRGLGRVDYDLADTGDGATMRAALSTQNEGGAISDQSSTRFSLSFVTDRDLRYVYRAHTGGGRLFSVAFDNFNATAENDVFGNLSGDWPGPRDPNGNTLISFDDILREGVLRAGTHTLVAEAAAGNERDGGGGADGNFSLVLTAADDGGNPIPLPPAAWTGLSALVGMASVAAARRRRAVC